MANIYCIFLKFEIRKCSFSGRGYDIFTSAPAKALQKLSPSRKTTILLLVQNVGHGKNVFDIQMTARAICPVQNWPKTIMAKEKSIGHQKAKFLRNHSFVTSAKDWVGWSRKLPVLLTFSNVWMVSK